MGLAMEHGGAYARTGDGARGCWYYLRYFFLFISLIQFLIILGLVLFMVYGNVHLSTEANLKATEIRATSLYSQVMELSAVRANLTKELNITTRTKDNIMQLLQGTRREADRINSSFRQCQSDLVIYINNQQYIAAIILSEQRCQEQLKATNKSCSDSLSMWDQKAKALEVELTKEKVICGKEKEGLQLSKQVAEEQLVACAKARQLQEEERVLAQEQLKKVQALCLPLDKDKFETDLRNLWRDSIIPRTLDTLGYNLGFHPVGSEVAAIRRSCDHMPSLMSAKVEELARGLRAGIERVARENADIQRQKLDTERSLRAVQEAKEKAEKEAQAREAKLQAGCAQQTQLALEEKAALRKERDNLAKELEEKKREVERLKMQVEVRISDLNTCLKAKSQSVPIPRPVGAVPPPQPIDPTDLEAFKKRILESQRPPAGLPAFPPSG